MKIKCMRLAMAAFVASSLFASTMSANFPGAIYTSNSTASIINANHYELKADVYLNGGPKEFGGPGALDDGIYLFEVTDPSGTLLLSEDAAKNRQVLVVGGVIYGVPAPGAAPFDADALHAVGGPTSNGSLPVQLIPFSDTPNGGGVYKVTLYSVAGGAYPDGDNIISPAGNKKSDNFKVREEDNGPGFDTVIIFGRKYYDKNANGVYDDGEEWTTADGRPPVTIDITPAGGGSGVAVTDDDGLWFYVFTVPSGQTLNFMACEEPVTDYNHTGPLDGDFVENGDSQAPNYASATAEDFCWSGTVSSSLGLAGLNFGNVDTVSISGVKYYDANANGEMDGGEVAIPGFKIVLEITYPDDTTDTVERVTDEYGAWSYEVPVGSSVTVCEVMPTGSWIQTAPEDLCHSLDDIQTDNPDLNFGNVCLGPGGGKTLGFWSNKNGEKVFNTIGGLAIVNALPLKNADGGSAVPFADYKKFRTWILGATATNMANMLSAQLAAMVLNVNSSVNGAQLIHTGGCGSVPEFASVNDVIQAAKDTLNADGYTPAGDALRSYQECLKDALDDANNNLNFVQPDPCDVVYPE